MAVGQSADLVREHFRRRRDGVLAAAAETVVEHNGLAGSHREAVVSEFLERILPGRFRMGTGMVYSLSGRSHQADIVIWDAANYPRIELKTHTFFFAESARVVLECKSNWDAAAFEDIRLKSERVKHLFVHPGVELGLESRVRLLAGQVAALQRGRGEEYSELVVPPHIATGGVVIRGGTNFRIPEIGSSDLDAVDDEWPDLLLMVEAGKVVLKDYSDAFETGRGVLRQYDLGEDCLLVFTKALLSLLAERVVAVEGEFYFDQYIPESLAEPTFEVQFPLAGPPQGRRPVFSVPGE